MDDADTQPYERPRDPRICHEHLHRVVQSGTWLVGCVKPGRHGGRHQTLDGVTWKT